MVSEPLHQGVLGWRRHWWLAFFLMHQEVGSVVCRVGGWHLQDLSLVVLPGFSGFYSFVGVMTGFFVVVVVVCVRFSIFINFSMEYTKHVYTCNFYKNDNLKSF